MPKRISPDPLPIAEIVDFLFKNIRKVDGSTYSEYEVSKAISLGASSVGFIRSGKTTNPGLDTIRKLCFFFEVPLTIFQCQTIEDVKEVIELHRRIKPDENEGEKHPLISEILMRASALSEAGKRDILKLVKMVNHAEAYRRGEIARLSPEPGDQDVAATR